MTEKNKKMTEFYKNMKKLEEKFGITAWNEILSELSKLQMKIEELIKSRDNWKHKYMELKK
tara:strand:- start:305 stop:487 length:183 start_codon:yes stop_codon:yes gene_type:complete